MLTTFDANRNCLKILETVFTIMELLIGNYLSIDVRVYTQNDTRLPPFDTVRARKRIRLAVVAIGRALVAPNSDTCVCMKQLRYLYLVRQ